MEAEKNHRCTICITICQVDPPQGSTAGGTELHITGAGFAYVTQAALGKFCAKNWGFLDSAELKSCKKSGVQTKFVANMGIGQKEGLGLNFKNEFE